MTLDSERQEIEAQYAANEIAGVSIGYDGQKFDISPPCIRLTIRSGAAFQASLGSPNANIARHSGVAFFEVIVEGGEGSAKARGYAETIMGIYRNKNLGSVRCRIPYVSASREEEPHLILVVAVPFTRDALNA